MNKQIIEAMAKADGFVFVREIPFNSLGSLYSHPDGVGYFPSNQLPDYFTDNEIDRMVRDLKDDLRVAHQYVKELMEIVGQDIGNFGHYYPIEVAVFALATTAQKVEAYLKAIGKWTKEME